MEVVNTPGRLVSVLVLGSLAVACTIEKESPRAKPAEQTNPPVLDAGGTAAITQTRPPYSLETETSFVRVGVARTSDGTVKMSPASEVALRVLPVPSLAAEYLVAAYDGDTVVASVPVSFPDATFTAGLRDGNDPPEKTANTTAFATAFLETTGNVDRIALLAPSGEVADELTGDELPPRSDAGRGAGAGAGSAGSVGTLSSALTQVELAARFPHITFLHPGDEYLLTVDQVKGGNLVNLTQDQNNIVADYLDRLPPALFAAVQSFGVVKWSSSSFGSTSGSTVVVSLDKLGDAQMPGAFVHEAAHSFVTLTKAVATNSEDLSDWPEFTSGGRSARDLAASVVKKYDLANGLLDAWNTIQQTGKAVHLALDYVGEGYKSISLDDARKKGAFATEYGASDADEDLADYAGTTEAPSSLAPGICPLFAGLAGSKLTYKVATPYAKLALLLGTGVITEEAFTQCTNGVRIDPEPGIHFEGSLSFETDLKYGWRDEAGSSSFGLLGSGPDSYNIWIEFVLGHSGASPLGLHRLREVGFIDATKPGTSSAYISNDNPLLARVATQGLVLVTESSSEGVKGALFSFNFRNAAGIVTDQLPYGTFKIP